VVASGSRIMIAGLGVIAGNLINIGNVMKPPRLNNRCPTSDF
jgi:hypothetical protein